MSFFQELKRRNVFKVAIAYGVTAWLLMQLTDVLADLLELPSGIGKIVVALLVIGFPLALFFAWAFELTPDGVKREGDVERADSITPQTGKKLDHAIIFGLVAVIALMAVERFWFAGKAPEQVPIEQVAKETANAGSADEATAPAEKAASASQQSVAVLPFTAMTSGEDDEYFADGLTEEILNSLAGLPELLVTARTSSFHFKGQDLPVPEIARTLGVEHVVEGSVRRAGERVRITAQLIRAQDGFHLWSNTYDRTLEDVFAVQEDIAESIAQTLDIVLDDSKRQRMKDAGIGNVEAFIAYQKGMAAYDRAHASEVAAMSTILQQANTWFDQALAVVPDITNALLMRTDRFGHILFDHANGLTPASEEALESAMAEIKHGLQQARRAARSPAQAAILDAELTLFLDDWTGLAAKLDRAFAPGDCSPLNWIGSLAAVFGWAEEAANHIREEMRCDPLQSLNDINLSSYEMWNGRTAEMLKIMDRKITETAPHPWVNDNRFWLLLQTGEYQSRADDMGANPPGSFHVVPRRIFLHAKNGDLDAARQLLHGHLAEESIDDATTVFIAAALGDREQANQHAALIDARVGGTLALTELIAGCTCGAPFDLDATPNFKARIEEAGFPWPPADIIQFPAKDW